MCLGVLHLHTHDIIHRDIKCMNLLLKDNGSTLKLGDLSESRVLTHQSYIKTNKLIGTPQSLSPEVIKNENYDQRSDVWALGVALYHAACLEPPFVEDSMQALFKSILYKNPKPIHTCYSPRLSEFIFKMLEKKKNNRPLVIDLLEHFNQVPMPQIGTFNIHKN
jgi:NIMA (never in mitosis gene a)-related kinase